MNKTEMIRRPMAFIGSMAAIMNKLQGVDQRGITQKAILVKIDSAIECTLKLLGLDGDNKILIFLVREELFEKKYLAFIDYSGAAPRDHKLVFQLEVMDSEDPQQAKFF